MIGRYYNTHKGRRVIDKLILKLPLFGDLIMKTATAQFCRIFQLTHARWRSNPDVNGDLQ